MQCRRETAGQRRQRNVRGELCPQTLDPGQPFGLFARHALSLFSEGGHLQIHLPHHGLGLVAIPRDDRPVVGVVDLAQRVLRLEILQRAEHTRLLLGKLVHTVTPGRDRFEVDG